MLSLVGFLLLTSCTEMRYIFWFVYGEGKGSKNFNLNRNVQKSSLFLVHFWFKLNGTWSFMVLVWGFLIFFILFFIFSQNLLFAWFKLKQLNLWHNCWFSCLYMRKLQKRLVVKIYFCFWNVMCSPRKMIVKNGNTVKLVQFKIV